jgi:hypothetical protein
VKLTPTLHAVKRYAQRVMGVAKPTGEDMKRAARAIERDFADCTVMKPHDHERRCKHDHLRIAITRKGVHALVGRSNLIVTVYEPGTAVNGCWCTWCLCARAPKLKRMAERRRDRRKP